MATLYFKVQADWEEVQKLRSQIAKLKEELRKTDPQSEKFGKLNDQLFILTERFNKLTEQAALAGAQMEKALSTAGTPIEALAGQISSLTEQITSFQDKASQIALKSPVDTSEIVEAAKSYKELKNHIEAVIGTTEKHASSVVKNAQEVSSLTSEIKSISKEIGVEGTMTDEQRKRLEELTIERERCKQSLSSSMSLLKTDVKLSQTVEGSINQLTQSLAKMKNAYRLLSEEQRNSSFGKELLASIQQADNKLKELNASIGNHQQNVGNYASALTGLRDSVSLLPGPVGEAANSLIKADSALKTLTASSLKFIATPVGAVIAAIVAALAALTSWFRRTEEGQNALNVATSYFSQILNSVLDIADDAGEWLYRAFTKPKEALNDLLDFLKGQVTNRLEAFGKAGQAIVKIFSGDWKDGLNDLLNANMQFLTGIEDAGNRINSFAADANKKAQERMKIAERQNALDKKEREWLVKKTELEAQISELRAKAMNSNISEAERLKSVKQAETLINKLYQTETELARERHEITKATNELSHSNKEDLTKEAEQLAKINTLESQRSDALRSLLRQSNKLESGSTANAITAQSQKLKELEEKQARDRAKSQQDLENQVEQARIDALTDSFEKTQAQQKLNDKKEIEALERQKEDYIDAYIQSQREIFDAREQLKAKQDKNYKVQTFTAPERESIDTSAFDGIIAKTREKQEARDQRQREKAWRDYNEKYGSYLEKRNAIVQRYDEELSKYQEDSGEYASLKKERDNELDDLDMSVRNSANLMAQLFADTSKKSVSEIQDIIDRTELLIQFLQKAKDEEGNVTIGGKVYNADTISSKVGISRNQLDNLASDPTALRNLTDGFDNLKGRLGSQSPFKLLQTQIKDSIKLIGDKSNKKGIALGIQNIGDAIVDFAPALSQFGQDIGNIFGSSELGDKISGVVDGLGGLAQTGSGIGQIMSGDIVGGVMSAVSGISQVVTSVEGLFGADYSRYNKMVEQYEGLISVWDVLIGRKKEYISMSWGDETIKASEEAINLIGKEADAWKQLGIERLNAGSSAGSHSIGVRMQKSTTETDWAGIATALGVSVQRAKDLIDGSQVGGRMQGLFNLTSEQLKKLQEEAPAFWARMDEDVRNYLEKIISGAERIEEVNKLAQEQLTQVSFDSMFDSFVSSLMDMKSSSKDAADDISGYFMQAMLSNRIGEMYREKLKSWYDKFANSMEGGLTSDEMSALREEYLGYVKEALEERNTLAEITGYKSSYSQSASSKSWAGMSQDQADGLDGRFTALQESGRQIEMKEDVKINQLNILNATASDLKGIQLDVKDIASETRDMMANMYLEVREINQNTGSMDKTLKLIQKSAEEISRNTK